MDPDAFQFHKVPDTTKNRFRGHLLVSDQVSAGDVEFIWNELDSVLSAKIPGAIVEFGCYAGTTSLFIRRLLDERGQSTSREFHVYDSFAGLPEKSAADQSAAGVDFMAGKLNVSKKAFLRQFHTANLQPPVIHKGWFDELTDADVPGQIAFAFLDGDFYGSILRSLILVWPKMAPGGVMLVDDYQRAELPGAERAVHDYFNGQASVQVRANIAKITKQ
ncbi:MAG: TylF/MycF/NovP-related O-methyltransferase [Candidatus Saccharimonadales bacterium]